MIHPQADETLPKGASPEQAACLLAIRKAESVADHVTSGTIIGADTIVVAGDEIIGKPRDALHAARILRLLSSHPHEVITGLCLLDAASGRRREAFGRTRIFMRRMTEEQIAAYIATGESMGKAGAYAIQETGDRFVERIEGSLTNVVGLPMELLGEMIREFEGDHA